MTKIEELRAAYENATPGEWVFDGDEINTTTDLSDEQAFVCCFENNTEFALTEQDYMNADFIALAHNAMPALLEAVEKIQELASWLRLRHMNEASDADVEETIEEAEAFLTKLEGA